MEITAFIQRCDAYCERAGIARATLSNKLLFDSRRLQALSDGSVDIGVKRLERAFADLLALEAAEADGAPAEPLQDISVVPSR